MRLQPGEVCTLLGVYPFNKDEQEQFTNLSSREVLSLNFTQMRILYWIVLPYWENYLKAIEHHNLGEPKIHKVTFEWVNRVLVMTTKPQPRTAKVVMSCSTEVDRFPTEVVFQIEVDPEGVPRTYTVFHEGRGRLMFDLHLSFP